jgi:hypothetical protein
MAQNNFQDAGELTPAQRADALRHYYARGRKILADVSDALGVLCYRQEPLGADELEKLQDALVAADGLMCVATVGEIGMPLADCDHYSDGSPVRSVENDSTGYDSDAAGNATMYATDYDERRRPAPWSEYPLGPFLSADIWPVALVAAERIVHEPPHRRGS